MKTPTKIAIIGAGYVGMSLALILSRNNYVTILDTNHERVKAINNRESFFKDKQIKIFLKNQSINLKAVSSQNKSFRQSELFLICTPTDFDENTQSFNTNDIEQIVKDILSFSPNVLIVIKSTIPIGFINKLQRIFFIPLSFSGKVLH
jgi:UDPglucose 6-dehydrogenase